MNGIRAVFHLLRADYLERVRRSSFLIILGLTVVAGYFYLPANSASTKTLAFTISFSGSGGPYRGVYNSAWVGTQVVLFASLWLSIIGFYLVKNALDRDVSTGVGQIIATTSLSKVQYTLGKALSNFAVLGTMTLILAIAAAATQLLRAEDTHIDLWALLSPFVLIMLPTMAVVAALAILFETVGWLRGTLGNVVYFFLISTVIPLSFAVNTGPVGDLLGSSNAIQQMQIAAQASVPGYNGGFEYGTRFGTTFSHTFHWTGIQWTSEVMLGRLFWVGVALCIALLAALFFTRFDTAKESQQRASKKAAKAVAALPDPVFNQETPVLVQHHLTPLPAQRGSMRLGAVLIGELRLMLKGVAWWWFIVVVALIALCFLLPFNVAHGDIFPLAWLWPLPLWSALGNREARHHTTQLIFSTAHPLLRQLSMQWLAGVLIALVTASGMIARFAVMSDWHDLIALGIGAVFIPALALATGVWTGNSRLFEVAYVIMWYVGGINHLAALDFMGVTGTTISTHITSVFAFVTALLLLLALLKRRQQLQN